MKVIKRLGIMVVAAAAFVGVSACGSDDDSTGGVVAREVSVVTTNAEANLVRACWAEYRDGFAAWSSGDDAATPELERQYWSIADAYGRGQKQFYELLHLYQIYECGDVR